MRRIMKSIHAGSVKRSSVSASRFITLSDRRRVLAKIIDQENDHPWNDSESFAASLAPRKNARFCVTR